MASLHFLVNGGFIPTTFAGIFFLASIVSATVYIFVEALLKRRVDENGNPLPNGPVGVPIIGVFYS